MHEKRKMADSVAILWLSMIAIMCTAPWDDVYPPRIGNCSCSWTEGVGVVITFEVSIASTPSLRKKQKACTGK